MKIEKRRVQDGKDAKFAELLKVSGIYKREKYRVDGPWAMLKRRAKTDLDRRPRCMTLFEESFGRFRGLDELLSACTENSSA
jgi:hypothetical protein